MYQRMDRVWLKYREAYVEVFYLGVIARSDGTILHVVEENLERVYMTAEKNIYAKVPIPGYQGSTPIKITHQ